MLDLPVPDPGPPGPFGTMPWLRATVSRFANGETHARRRARVEARLAALDPHALAVTARAAVRDDDSPTPGDEPAGPVDHLAGPGDEAPTPADDPAARDDDAPTPADDPAARDDDAPTPGHDPAVRGGAAHRTRFAGVPRPYLPVAVLAAATGVSDPVAAVAHTRVVAAAYHPGTDAPGADEALAALLALLPEPDAHHVAILVQACEATAGLVRGDDLPVKTTKRVTPDGAVVAVPLDQHPFGDGPRRCPGERHARALAEALR